MGLRSIALGAMAAALGAAPQATSAQIVPSGPVVVSMDSRTTKVASAQFVRPVVMVEVSSGLSPVISGSVTEVPDGTIALLKLERPGCLWWADATLIRGQFRTSPFPSGFVGGPCRLSSHMDPGSYHLELEIIGVTLGQPKSLDDVIGEDGHNLIGEYVRFLPEVGEKEIYFSKMVQIDG